MRALRGTRTTLSVPLSPRAGRGDAQPPCKSRLAILALAITPLLAAPSHAQTPFQPPTPPTQKIVRLLAFPEYFDPHALEAFEKATGYQVAYDTYSLQLEIPEKLKQGPYDVVALPGQALIGRIAAGALAKLDKARLPHARDAQPAVLAKLAAYDPSAAYSVPFGWAPYGLLYESQKVPPRLGGAPSSWSALLTPQSVRNLGPCGAVIPNARDAMFVATWRLMGLEPWKVGPAQIKFAAAILAQVKPALQGFAVADPVGALARDSACLTAGTSGEADAANARAKRMGKPATIAFVFPREGGGVSIDSLAVPRDAPNPAVAHQLIDFLLRADNAAADARAAGLNSSLDGRDLDLLKRASPIGAWDDRFGAVLEAEWTPLRAGKPPPPLVDKSKADKAKAQADKTKRKKH